MKKRNQISGAEELAAERQAAIDRLAEYGLSRADSVKWNRTEGGTYIEGSPSYVNKDRSICVSVVNGPQRSVMASELLVYRRGPRGGDLWVPQPELIAD